MLKDSQRLKIAIFTEVFLPKVDGIVSIICLMLRRLNELGHEVLIIGPKTDYKTYEGAKIISVDGPPFPFYPEFKINIARPYVRKEIQRFQPDIIHSVNPVFLGPYGIYFARRHKIPLLASFHTDVAQYVTHYGFGFTSPLIWAFFRLLHNRADLNLGPSTYVRDELIKHNFKEVHWWKRGIDTDFFSRGECDPAMRHRLTEGHPDDFLLIYVGRNAREKGLYELRDAIFPRPGVRLAIVGGGPAHEDLKAYFAGTPTVFPGYLHGEDLIQAYRAADAFVFPSTTETFGLVALEAMACGLPVIAVKAGGIVDSVIDGVNGLFYEPEKYEQLGLLVDRLHHDVQLRHKLAENGWQHAQSRSWRATMDQLVDYYHMTIRLATGEKMTHPA